MYCTEVEAEYHARTQGSLWLISGDDCGLPRNRNSRTAGIAAPWTGEGPLRNDKPRHSRLTGKAGRNICILPVIRGNGSNSGGSASPMGGLQAVAAEVLL